MTELDIFTAALEEADPAARAQYLDRACGGRPELRCRIETLLRNAARGCQFLESPALGEPTVDHSPPELPGAQVGPYKLVEQIGEGGMGVVFMAEQTAPVRRKVALKVIKPGMDTKQVIARFEAERQALAIMDHANIAKIHDAGATDSGRPFFVMELVRGVPITDYCDQYKLDLKSRLQLFIDVCRAVQHAHQKGVIHRDIKPTNVLVSRNDAASVPKVIDFGIAKATGRQLTGGSAVTGFKQMLGTPLYMSPEQAEMNNLDVDTRSDVYSLGVLLYELLTGHTPFDKRTFDAADYDELRRLIREVDPPRPSNRLSTLDVERQSTLAALRGVDVRELSRHLRGELDWIVMKALEKDRARRYASAEDLARDVERHLHDQPVEACPPSAAYRLKKFAKRNKGVLSATCLVAAALLLGTGVSVWQAIRATEAERLAEANADESETHRKLAEANADESETNRKLAEANALESRANAELAQSNARQAANEAAVAKAVNEFLQRDLLGLADAAAQLGVQIEPDPEIKLTTLLDRALAKVDARFANQPWIRVEIQSTLAHSFHAIGQYPEAIKLREQVREYCQTTLGPEHPDTLTSMNNLAQSYQEVGQLDKALPLLEQTLELWRKILGPEHPDTLTSMSNLALGYRDAGQFTKALPLHEQTLELRRKVLGPEHPHTLTSMSNLAVGYGDAGQLAKALPLHVQTLELERKVLGPEHPHTLASMSNLALGNGEVGQLDKALPLLEQTLELRRKISGPEHPDTLASMNNLARGYLDAGQLDKALPLLEQTLELRRKISGPEHPKTLASMNNLAVCYRDAGQLDKALPLLEQTLELQRKVLGPEHPDTLASMNNLAQGYRAAGQLAKALPLHERTLELQRKVLGPEHPDTLTSMNNLAVCYRDAGQLDKALPLLEQTLELRRKVLGPEHPDTLASMNNLAQGYGDAGQLDKALPLYEQTLELNRKILGPGHPRTLNSMNNLATGYWSARQLDKSIPLFEETVKRRIDIRGPNHPDTLNSMANLGVNYRDAGRLAEALPLLEKCHALAMKHPRLAWVAPQLADAYTQAGRHDQAETIMRDMAEQVKAQAGAGSPEYAGQLAQLGLNLLEQQKPVEAEPVLRESLTIREQKAPDDWRTFNTRSLLGGALLGQQKYAEAEPLLVAGYEGMRDREATIPPPGRTRPVEALERLVQLYEATNQPDQAARWREELTKVKDKLAAGQPAPPAPPK